MIQRPNAAGLTLCQLHIIDAQTRGVSLINTFARLAVSRFPSPPQGFTVHAILTDGLGRGTLSLGIARLDTLERVYRRDWPVNFVDPLAELRMLVRVRTCSFPVPGRYEVNILADDESVAQYVLTVVQRRP
jgi:hypothetical protein